MRGEEKGKGEGEERERKREKRGCHITSDKLFLSHSSDIKHPEQRITQTSSL